MSSTQRITRESLERKTVDDVRDRALKIELLLLDVDGVLTDGRVTYTANGDEIKRFHVRDGSGLKIWRDLGLRAAVISGRPNSGDAFKKGFDRGGSGGRTGITIMRRPPS